MSEIIKAQIPISVLKKIREDLMIPILGTHEEKKKIIEKQNYATQFIIKTFYNKKDDEGKKRIIQSGIVDILIFIFGRRELSQITRNIILAFQVLSYPYNDEIILLLYQKNPFSGLLRLYEHRDNVVTFDGLLFILNIIVDDFNTTSDNSHRPYYDTINACRGIEKIMKLFRINGNKKTKDTAAIRHGQIFRAKEINDKQMPIELIRHLKTLVNDTDEWTYTNSKLTLCHLALNTLNRAEIESDVFAIPE
ncbi:MAG: hypothetical protein EZS28_041362 [Streblomastix strix]|uniref:Uncharacterized protein n=1 Tax=Streblomastix strix TaxID=222440 RepID=A0A5J4TYE3_9EUKA|nr:MAG: hypothetical protein EZS28_041362 [Streblomastix strix]